MLHTILLTTLCLTADPATMGKDGLVPVATPAHVRAFTSALGLDDEQLGTASLVIEDYEGAMRDVHAAMLQTTQAARDQLEDAFAGRRRLSVDALRRLRVQIEDAPRDAWPSLDGRLDELTDTLALLSSRSDADIVAASSAFRRHVMQHAVLDRQTSAGALMRLDVRALAAEAADSELKGVTVNAIDTALAGYQASLNASMPAWFKARRADRVDDALASIMVDDAARHAIMEASCRRWEAMNTLHLDAIESVADLAKAAGGERAGVSWLRRCEHARFPLLYDDPQLRAMRDWIDRNGNDVQRASVQQAYDNWLESVRPVAVTMSGLLRQAFKKGADLQHDAVARHAEAAKLRRTWLQASGDRQVRLEAAKAAMERQLTDGQRAAVRRSMMEHRSR
jgi:hypothetical protein